MARWISNIPVTFLFQTLSLSLYERSCYIASVADAASNYRENSLASERLSGKLHKILKSESGGEGADHLRVYCYTLMQSFDRRTLESILPVAEQKSAILKIVEDASCFQKERHQSVDLELGRLDQQKAGKQIENQWKFQPSRKSVTTMTLWDAEQFKTWALTRPVLLFFFCYPPPSSRIGSEEMASPRFRYRAPTRAVIPFIVEFHDGHGFRSSYERGEYRTGRIREESTRIGMKGRNKKSERWKKTDKRVAKRE